MQQLDAFPLAIGRARGDVGKVANAIYNHLQLPADIERAIQAAIATAALTKPGQA